MCNFTLEKAVIAARYQIDFDRYFADDLALLQCFIDDDLVRVTDQAISVTKTGRMLIRNICMSFDIYLRDRARQQQFSRVI